MTSKKTLSLPPSHLAHLFFGGAEVLSPLLASHSLFYLLCFFFVRPKLPIDSKKSICCITSFPIEHFTHLRPVFFGTFFRLSAFVCVHMRICGCGIPQKASECFVHRTPLQIILIVILLFWSFQDTLRDKNVRKMSSCRPQHWVYRQTRRHAETCEGEHASEQITVGKGHFIRCSI